MQVNALQFKNQMETFGSRNGDQMGPWAAESGRYVRNVFFFTLLPDTSNF